ncbi:hypothetical protein ACGFZH_03060 [Streptomyces zaomyceticus]|uniref:hypothetical protein n=1 Tax=Streptomyces zaomyceticus TaxID=68286 RepID=UPI00167991A6|nr:hypothetical protein [Streptomyces zaomyceticus]GHG37160.1 hypothetical protein GCM10018791_63500 [Streptomyces zaomyceticus]
MNYIARWLLKPHTTITTLDAWDAGPAAALLKHDDDRTELLWKVWDLPENEVWLRTPLPDHLARDLKKNPDLLIPEVLNQTPSAEGIIEVYSTHSRAVIITLPYASGRTASPEVEIATHVAEYATQYPAIALHMAQLAAASPLFRRTF